MDRVADGFEDLLLSVIPLFVAVDVVGVLPFVLSLTKDMKTWERTRTIRYALITALGLGLGFVAIGRLVFLALDIESADFLVVGGLLLLVLAIKELATGKFVEIQASSEEHALGIVPLGTPLIVGPAVLATLLLLIKQYSIPIVLAAFVLNLAFASLIFAQANRVANFLGPGD